MISRMRNREIAGIAALVVVMAAGAGVAALRAHDASPTGAQAPTGGVPSAAPTTSASRTASAPTSPFTGQRIAGPGPVLAVKIDNVRPARPQTGLAEADIVYVEPVEGGLSRILAIFSSSLPKRIGPVRSARESDLELLAQFGRPALVYSGANSTVQKAIREAPLVDLAPSRAGSAYSRSPAKRAPHNLLVDPRALLRKAEDADPASDIGFRFGPLPAGRGTPARSEVVRHGAARTGFTWSAKRERWDVSLDGRTATTTDGGRLGAATVVLQYTEITDSELRDVLGNPTPYTHTVGSGRAVVLRDGVAIDARWSRPSPTEGTSFSTATGEPVPFAPGQIWVVYAKAGD